MAECLDCKGPCTKTRCQKCYWKSMRGTGNHRYRTGKSMQRGYVILNGMHDHPNYFNKGRIGEHVYVMSQMLGRALYKGEEVHHKNGVKTDNRPENLELWVVSQPSGQRPEDLVAWAKEILERYDDLHDM